MTNSAVTPYPGRVIHQRLHKSIVEHLFTLARDVRNRFERLRRPSLLQIFLLVLSLSLSGYIRRNVSLVQSSTFRHLSRIQPFRPYFSSQQMTSPFVVATAVKSQDLATGLPTGQRIDLLCVCMVINLLASWYQRMPTV